MTVIRNYYDFEKEDGIDVRALGGPSLTKEAPREQTDVNVIMARYFATGIPPEASEALAQYVDLTEFGSMAECMIRTAEIGQAFNDLPSSVRERFANDPRVLVETLAAAGYDEGIRKELQAIGLLKPISSPDTAPEGAAAPEAPPAGAAEGSPPSSA